MAALLEEKNQLLEKKRGELAELLKKHKDEKTGEYKSTMNKDVILEVRDRNDEPGRSAHSGHGQ